MKLQKVLWGGLFVAFFFSLFQIVRVLVPSFLKICNPAGAWGIPLSFVFLSMAGIFFLLIVIFFCLFSKEKWERISWLLIFSGGISNLFERFRYGCVSDYLSLTFFPTLNLADLSLSLGVLFLIFALLKKKNS